MLAQRDFASEQPGNGYGPHSYLKRARHHRVDGVVLMGIDTSEPEVERLLRSDIACVGVDMAVFGSTNCSVMSDNVEGGAMAVRHLAELGHKRIATITGLIESAPELNLVLTDITMPQLDGIALVRHLREKHPQLRVMMMSGYPDAATQASLGQALDTMILAKPFTLERLLEAVRKILDETR